MISSTPLPTMATSPLTVIRIPGPHGPILRCQGSLTVSTTEVLRRDLGLLSSSGHGGVVINLNGIRQIDQDGVLALVDLAEPGRSRLVLAVATEPTAGYLHLTGVDRVLPIYRTEAEAVAALAREDDTPEAGRAEAREHALAVLKHSTQLQ